MVLVGVIVAEIVTVPKAAGLKLQDTEPAFDGTLEQPGIALPFARNVTFPGVFIVAVIGLLRRYTAVTTTRLKSTAAATATLLTTMLFAAEVIAE